MRLDLTIVRHTLRRCRLSGDTVATPELVYAVARDTSPIVSSLQNAILRSEGLQHPPRSEAFSEA